MEADDDGFGQTGARAARSQDETGAGGGSSGGGAGGGSRSRSGRIEKVLRGRKGFELYVQCLQILLQKQVWWLVKHKGFPDELEVLPPLPSSRFISLSLSLLVGVDDY